ncbi:MAG: CARDB domain-containing protein, partial [Planctomycetota bacterium]
ASEQGAKGTRLGIIGMGTGGDFRKTIGLDHRLDHYCAAIAGGGGVIEEGSADIPLSVLDSDGPALQLTVGRDVISEGAGPSAATATVCRNTDTTDPLVVTLSSFDTSELTVPTTVTIPAGSDSATFNIDAVSDGIPDGVQTVTITASAAGFTQGLDQIDVTDVDLPDLRVTSIAVPAMGRTGGMAQVTWTVRNDGLAPATGQWADSVYVSTDPYAGGDTLVNAVLSSGPLAVGQSYQQTMQVTLPQTVGDIWVIIVTDSVGLVDEGLGLGEGNNATVSARPINVSAAYNATVATDFVSGPAGPPVPLHGQATDSQTGLAAPNVPVAIRVRVREFVRTINVTTDASGQFTAVFQPLPGEAGTYTISADHPAAADEPAEDQFVLYGMGANPGSLSLRVIPGTALIGQIDLRNFGDTPLTAIAATVVGAPTNLTVNLTAPAALAGLESKTIFYELLAADASVTRADIQIELASADGATCTLAMSVDIVPLTAELVVSPSSIEAGMVRGQQRLIQFTITNAGGTAAENVVLQIPEVPWLSVVSGTAFDRIAQGGQATVILALAPDSNLPLGEYRGSMALTGGTTTISIPFVFRAVSDAVGEVSFRVVDDYTYYVAGEPCVTGATITLLDSLDGHVVAEGVSNDNGVVTFAGVPEGGYRVLARASEHISTTFDYWVDAGAQQNADLFLSADLLSYNFWVDQTETQDAYRLVTEAVFKTDVPLPLLVVENPDIEVDLQPGESTTVDLVLTNVGLVEVVNVTIPFGISGDYDVVPLVDRIAVIPGKSTLRVPLRVTRLVPQAVTVSILSSPEPSQGESQSNGSGGGFWGCVYNVWFGKVTSQNVCRIPNPKDTKDITIYPTTTWGCVRGKYESESVSGASTADLRGGGGLTPQAGVRGYVAPSTSNGTRVKCSSAAAAAAASVASVAVSGLPVTAAAT